MYVCVCGRPHQRGLAYDIAAPNYKDSITKGINRVPIGDFITIYITIVFRRCSYKIAIFQ